MNEAFDEDFDSNVVSLDSFRRKKGASKPETSNKSTNFQQQNETVESDRKKHNSNVLKSYRIEPKKQPVKAQPKPPPPPPPRQERAVPERSVQEYDSDVNLDERIERIKTSIVRINALMAELRSMTPKT
jgi:hypothetical protein